jgi:4-hydroxy-3-methylbut-2-en-1-yl diphosphate synthase IspG/GcpE
MIARSIIKNDEAAFDHGGVDPTCRHCAEAPIVTDMLFCSFSAMHHAATAIREDNMNPGNLMHPRTALHLFCVPSPSLISTLMQ